MFFHTTMERDATSTTNSIEINRCTTSNRSSGSTFDSLKTLKKEFTWKQKAQEKDNETFNERNIDLIDLEIESRGHTTTNLFNKHQHLLLRLLLRGGMYKASTIQWNDLQIWRKYNYILWSISLCIYSQILENVWTVA